MYIDDVGIPVLSGAKYYELQAVLHVMSLHLQEKIHLIQHRICIVVLVPLLL